MGGESWSARVEQSKHAGRWTVLQPAAQIRGLAELIVVGPATPLGSASSANHTNDVKEKEKGVVGGKYGIWRRTGFLRLLRRQAAVSRHFCSVVFCSSSVVAGAFS